MANYLLKPVFKSIFNKDFQPNLFEDRLEMQKPYIYYRIWGFLWVIINLCGINMDRILKLYKMIF